MSDNALWVQDRDLARQLAGLQSYVRLEIGNRAVPGVVTTGVYPEEHAGPVDFRWTNGHGVWQVPVHPGEAPTGLALELGVFGPTPATVQIDGRVALDQTLEPGSNQFHLPLSLRPEESNLSIVIDSTTFSPTAPPGFDRILGVKIQTMRLR
jgi:2',3'-cyclic-nucleotide 2'-phosphodiesterase (5'-nucleotidase family)